MDQMATLPLRRCVAVMRPRYPPHPLPRRFVKPAICPADRPWFGGVRVSPSCHFNPSPSLSGSPCHRLLPLVTGVRCAHSLRHRYGYHS